MVGLVMLLRLAALLSGVSMWLENLDLKHLNRIHTTKKTSCDD